MSSTSLGALDLPLPTFIPRRYRPGELGTWSGHLCFANDLVSAVQPSLLVELGTHWGESYFGFCQSVLENGGDCLCYAVDNWVGEAHAGYYGEEVFEDVQRHNETYFRAFSYLLRKSFDEAVSQFLDGSIDLLHIDGLHTYEAVSHDFRTWLSKVKPGGLILFHDIAVRHADFGVWRLWNEIETEFPQTFAFHHQWGLGVMRKPGGTALRPALLDLLFDSTLQTKEAIRRHYILYASYLENILRPPEKISVPAAVTSTRVQVFPLSANGYSEDPSLTQNLDFGRWSTLAFEFPRGITEGPLQINPADCPCVVEIGRIAVLSKEAGGLLWSAKDSPAMRSLAVSGSALILPHKEKYLLFSYGHDPRLQLPDLDCAREPVRVEISICINHHFDAVFEALNEQAREIESARVKVDTLSTELQNAHNDRTQTEGELFESNAGAVQVVAEGNKAHRELRMVESLVDSLRVRLREENAKSKAIKSALEAELEVLRESRAEANVDELRNALESERAVRLAMQHSRSWRITKPFRGFMHLFKK